MKRVLTLLAAGLVLAPSASAAERRLLVNGDSLAEGTRPYIPKKLPDWRVRQSTKVSRHASEGADVLRRFGRSLPRVIHVSLGTNDDPSQVEGFSAAIEDVMEVAGERRCVVWTNIVRPPYRGTSYDAYNRALAREDRERDNLRVVNWARMVERNRDWLADDGVHVSAEGYRARARAVAREVKRCRPAASTRRGPSRKRSARPSARGFVSGADRFS
jgi:lysophospholipase L1-like esterase